jgi:translation initiation factor IF-2
VPVVSAEPTLTRIDREVPKLNIIGKIDLSPKKPEQRPTAPENRPPLQSNNNQGNNQGYGGRQDSSRNSNNPQNRGGNGNNPRQNDQRVPQSPRQNFNKPLPPMDLVTPEKFDDTQLSIQPFSEDQIIKADTPQLKGLQIKGKIDLNQFDKPKKVVPERDRRGGGPNRPGGPIGPNGQRPATSGAPGSTSQGGLSEADKKKRRRRKKIANPASPNNTPGAQVPGQQGQQGQGQGQGQQGGYRPNNNAPNTGNRPSPPRDPNAVREISTKEIEDKLKATMARLNIGGGKGKGQKLRRDKRDKFREREELRQQAEDQQKLQVTEFISVSDLASLMDVPVGQVITTCMNLGYMVSINQRLDAELIGIIAEEFGNEVEFISAEEQIGGDQLGEEEDNPEKMLPRAPIVTVMGHVDHGKTSLLDFIRKTNVASGEAGGITQHIGAYEVKLPDGKKITFLDTPGHEAFTAMRARGAKVTDVAVVIIAADDNIMPQTKEAISHAQAAGVPIIFAINKIDKAGADANRIKQELASMNILVEEWGGKYQSQDISAKQGLNIEFLMEKILLEAEVLDLKADSEKKASGTVIEASLDKGRGYVTKMLVQGGTLKIGDALVAGETSGKIKAMFNEHGKKVLKAGPSTPVLVLGLSGAPQAGERFKVMDSETDARQIASKRAQIIREQNNRSNKRISLDEIGRRLALGNFKELNLIVKGDVDGSVEALADALLKQSHETVQVRVIHKAVGQIIESDVLLASASDAIIIGFQVRPSLTARKLAEREGVEIKTYSIIYEAIAEIRSAIEGMLEPTKEEKIVGQIEVREVYKISKIGTIAGCYVQEGRFTRNTLIRVIRDGIVVFPMKEGVVGGSLSSLKRFKDDAKEVKGGFECGLTIENYNDIQIGDTIEGLEIIEIKQKLAKA